VYTARVCISTGLFFNIGPADEKKSEIEMRKAEAEARREEMKAEVESHCEEARAFHEMMMMIMMVEGKTRIITSCLLAATSLTILVKKSNK
jgi:hypothetical protein